MKSQKNSPSLGLYKEGLLQLRFMGLLSGGLIILVTAALAAVTLILTRSLDQGALGGVASVVDPTSLVSLAELAVWLLPFLFILRLFNFLNKRNRSDFYHALPASRLELYFSLLAAALTWLWGIGLVVVALAVGASLIAGAAFTFATVISALGLFLTASLFAAAATLVAASVTGTRFSNLVVTALIVLLPHLIASFFVQAIGATVPNLPVSYIGLIGGVSVQNTFFMLSPAFAFFGTASAGPVSNGASIAVTFVWSAVLIALAAWFFVRRPSEAAGKSAPSRSLQLLYRVAVGVLVVALGMSAILGLSSGVGSGLMLDGPVTDGVTTSLSAAFQIGSIVTLFVITLIVFLVFELITTRKWQRVLRALPSFGIVIVFALAFYGGIWAYSSYEKNFKPQANQIVSVRLLSTEYGMDGYPNEGLMSGILDGSFVNVDQSTYNQLLLQKVNITDSSFLQATADKLQEYFPPDAAYGGTDENHSAMLLEIRLKSGRTAFRLVNVRTGTKPDAFNRAIFSTPDLTHALLALPPLDKYAKLSSGAFMAANGSPASSPISAAEQDRRARKLYTFFESEYWKLSPAEQYQILYGDVSGNPPAPSADATTVATFTGGSYLDFSGVLGTKTFFNSYYLITPQASETSWEMTRSELTKLLAKDPAGSAGSGVDELDLYIPQVVRAMYSSEEADANISTDPFWSVYSGSDGGSGASALELSNAEMNKAVRIIRPALSRSFALDAPYYVQVSYSWFKNADTSNCLIVPLTAQEAAALQALTKK